MDFFKNIFAKKWAFFRFCGGKNFFCGGAFPGAMEVRRLKYV